MEFIAGQDLASIRTAAARAGVQLPLPIVCRIIRDVCLGLNAAHTFTGAGGQPQPVIHRDVSPKNVMVSYTGHVKVIDFGIAKAKGRLVRTQTGQLRGTTSYMAPEQVTDGPLDARTDLFAVGIMLHELLTGERLYSSGASQTMLQIVEDPVAAPAASNASVPSALSDLALKALSKPPADRFQTGKAFARALEEVSPIADEDELAEFMQTIFEDRIASTQALLDAAQSELEPVRLSGLLRALNGNSAPAKATPRPTPPAVPSEGPTQPQPPRAIRRRRWALAAGMGALVVLLGVMGLVISAERPAADTPSALAAALKRGQEAMEARAYQRAEGAYADAASVEPSSFEAAFGWGNAAARGAKLGAARLRFERAVAVASTPREEALARVALAGVLFRLGDEGGGLRELRDAKRAVGQQAVAELLGLEPGLAELRRKFFAEVEPTPEPPGSAAPEASAAPSPAAEQATTAPEPRPRPPAARATGTAAAVVGARRPDFASADAVKLYREGLLERRAKNFERAAIKLERCVKLDPTAHPCFMVLGAVYASIASRDQSMDAYRKARLNYLMYLKVAPEDDEQIPKVRAILATDEP